MYSVQKYGLLCITLCTKVENLCAKDGEIALQKACITCLFIVVYKVTSIAKHYRKSFVVVIQQFSTAKSTQLCIKLLTLPAVE